MTTSARYINAITSLLDQMAGTQGGVLDQVAARCADTISGGGLVHLFGSAHSVIPPLDAFPRHGSFAGLNPLTDPRLMWHDVLGRGGVRELLWLERTEHYIDKFLEHECLNIGDVLIIFSHDGTKAAGIDAAMYANIRGVFTVGVSSHATETGAPVHSSGHNLSDVCDLSIDTGVPPQDAVVDIDGWAYPVGGSSTVVSCVVSHEIITRTAQALAGRGVIVPTFASPAVPGASLESNSAVFAAHRRLLHHAEERALAADDAPGPVGEGLRS